MSQYTIGRRSIVLAALTSLVAAATPNSAPGADRPKADRILVVKSERRFDLLQSGQVLRSYRIRLGPNPVGPKIFQYDGRTPEGAYIIDGRTRNTPYHLALHISYPQPENIARAGRYDLPAGGGILIHGTPGTGKRFERDWTDGCIAVSNRAIEEIWDLVNDGTPIEIRP
jgi:murein L,D-transpeptidase YafK